MIQRELQDENTENIFPTYILKNYTYSSIGYIC